MLSLRLPTFVPASATLSSTEAQASGAATAPRKAFSYSRASPSVRWPDLQLKEPEKIEDWITLSKELDTHQGPDADHAPVRHAHDHDDAHHLHDNAQHLQDNARHRKITGYTPPINPYIAAHGKSYPGMAAQSSFVASLIEPKLHPRRVNGKLIRLSKLALLKAKDWRERVQRLSDAIERLGTEETVADLLKEWHEQLAPTDMCFVLKRVGDTNWRRALEFYECYNVKRWYEPNTRMLAGILSILGRVRQVSLAEEIFDRASPSVGNRVQVFNAMMGVYARQGDCSKVQSLLNLMKERACDPDLITYNTVINARCKAGVMPGMATQLLKDMRKDRLKPDVITFNTLISACASRNDVAEAETIFQTMQSDNCEPDVWTYNALISLYGRTSGKEGRAIDYFHIMQRAGLVPDAVTFNSVLYAFAKTGRVDEFNTVMRQMKEAGCKADEITYNTMISMFGKLSLHQEALFSYHEMKNEGSRPDAVTFTVLIDALGKAELVDEAEKVFQEMSDANVSPTLQIFTAMMSAYAKASKLTDAQSTYECMLQTGIVPDHLAFCLMLNVFQKANLPQKAMAMYEKVIKRHFIPDLQSYGTLLHWFSQEGLLKEADIINNGLLIAGFPYSDVCETYLKVDLPDRAAQLLASLLDQGTIVSEQLLVNVLQSLGVLAKYNEAQLFVGSVSSSNPQLETLMHEALIKMLSEAKQISAAKTELEKARVNGKSLRLDTYRTIMTMFQDAEMPDQVLLTSSDMRLFGVELDDVCKNFVSNAYSKMGMAGSRQGSPSTMSPPGDTIVTIDSYIFVMESYGKQRLWERAESTFKEMQEAGFKPSLKAWNTLISAYAICGEYENARLAVAEMIADDKIPTTCTCVTMLQAVINAGRPQDICKVLQEMRQYGVNPGKDVFLDVIESSVNEGNTQVAKAVFYELKSAGYLPNMQVYRSLILLFAKLKLSKDAEKMVREMESDSFSPDVLIYNSLITLYGKMGYFRNGAEVFKRMQASGCSPDSYTFNSLIWIYSKCLKIQEALAMVRQMEKAGFTPDAQSYTALISACGRLRMLEAAGVLFTNARETSCNSSPKVFHAMMNVYRSAGQPEQVRRIYTEMRDAGIEPTLGTFHVLMDSYGKGGDPQQAEAVLDFMFETGLSPGPLQYAVVIGAHLKIKDYDRAIAKLASMKKEGQEPNFMIWTAVVAAASHCKESREAVKLLSALGDAGFSLPLRLLTEKNSSLFAEFDHILQGLESFGTSAGSGLTNVLLDLLWAFQMRGTAGKLFTIAIERKVYSSSMARVLVKDWNADFRQLSAGAALVALTLWLDQIQDAALQGFPDAPRMVTLVTGCSASVSNKTSVEKTVKVHLWTMGSPFLKPKDQAGLFKTKGHSLSHWIKDSPHCMDLKLRNFSVLPEVNTMEVHGGAFMPARLVAGLNQIEETMGELRPKKFRRLIHMTEMRRSEAIAAELKADEDRKRKGKVGFRSRRKPKLRKRLHKIQLPS